MNNAEKWSFTTYFLELFDALNIKISFKEYLSDRKTIEQINKKTDNIFYKIVDFAKDNRENPIIWSKDSIEDELIVPIKDFSDFLEENSVKSNVYRADEFCSAVADVLKRDVDKLNWLPKDSEKRDTLVLQPSEFYKILHVYMYLLFENHRIMGRLVRSSPNEQGLEIIRKKTNDSSKIERNATARKKNQENSPNDKQNTLKVRDDTNDSSKDKTKRDPKWTKAVLQRDKYTCQCCGYDKKKHLEAHHIYSFRDNEAYRTQVDNGITLCKFCHKKYHSEFGRDGANPYELMLFFKKYATK